MALQKGEHAAGCQQAKHNHMQADGYSGSHPFIPFFLRHLEPPLSAAKPKRLMPAPFISSSRAMTLP